MIILTTSSVMVLRVILWIVCKQGQTSTRPPPEFVGDMLITVDHEDSFSYLKFVINAVNAVHVKFLAECKQIPEEPEKYCFWQFCCKFTHFPSVKFS